MQSYGGSVNYPPSFNNPKMEHGRNSYRRKGIDMGNIIGDPFALATTSIATVSFHTRAPWHPHFPAFKN